MARKETIRVSSRDPANEPATEEFPLSDFDHTLPKIYTLVTLTFKLEDDVDRQGVIDKLCSGLQLTLSQYRSLRGTLQTDKSGKLWIQKKKHNTVEFITHWMDGPDDDFPSFEALEKADFPAATIDGDSLLPLSVTRKQPLTPLGESGDDDNPILVVQANIIRGGLILAVAVHHSCSDGPGTDGFLSQWAENTRSISTGTPPTPFDPLVLDRSPLTSHATVKPSKVEDGKGPFAFFTFKSPPTPPPDFKMPSISQVMFHFSTSGLTRLKEDAKAPGQTSASTYDSMVAVLWRCMTRARVPLFDPEGGAQTRLLHAVGLRKFVSPPLPDRYLGNALALPTPSMEVGALLDGDDALRRTAAVIRGSIQEATSEAMIRKTADWIASVENKACISININNFMGLDVAAASWSHMRSYQEQDFGFGLPKALRWPKPMVDGYIFVYPRRPKDDPEEGVELCVCLETGCMKRLMVDEELAKYAHPRGL